MPEKCGRCDVGLVDRMATTENPYAYTLSGLKDVFLSGIRVRKCPTCRGESPIIPGLGELHEVIAADLTRQSGLLRGDQIRFLRKHAGLPAGDFARLIGISPEHLSRVENGHTESLGESADRLVRFCAMAIAQDGEAARQTLMDLAKQDSPRLRKPVAKAHGRPVFSHDKKKGWRRIAA